MTKPRQALKPPMRRPFTERASEAAAAFAIEVATDPAESDADVAAARLAVTRRDPSKMSLIEISHLIVNVRPDVLRKIGELRALLAEHVPSEPADALPESTHATDDDEASSS